VAGDVVTVATSGLTGTFTDKNVGSGKAIAVVGASSLSGEDAANYVLQQVTGVTADITPAVLSLNGVGQSNMSFNSQDFRVNPSIAAAGFNAATYETRDGTSFNVYGGYRLSDNWSVKAEYTDFGKQKWGYNITGGNANSDLTVKGYSLAAVGTFPVVEKVSLLGEAGAFFYDAKRSPTHSGAVVPLTGTPEVSSKAGLTPYAAFGAQHKQAAVAPGRQAIGGEPIDPHITPVGRRLQNDFAKIFKPWVGQLIAVMPHMAVHHLGIGAVGKG